MKVGAPSLYPSDPAYGEECLIVLEPPYLQAQHEGRVVEFLLAVQEAGWLPETAADAIATFDARHS